jgi:hypothetical protein
MHKLRPKKIQVTLTMSPPPVVGVVAVVTVRGVIAVVTVIHLMRDLLIRFMNK